MPNPQLGPSSKSWCFVSFIPITNNLAHRIKLLNLVSLTLFATISNLVHPLLCHIPMLSVVPLVYFTVSSGAFLYCQCIFYIFYLSPEYSLCPVIYLLPASFPLRSLLLL